MSSVRNLKLKIAEHSKELNTNYMKMISKCSCVDVTPNLIVESTPESRIILDIREPLQYEKSHIKDSVNLMTSSLLLRRLQRGSLNIVSLLPESVVVQLENERCNSIVLCDENSSTLEMSRNLTVIATALIKSYPKKNVCFLMSKYCITFRNVNKAL